MVEGLFPRHITNDYRGRAVAKWVFVLITLITLVRSLIHIFAPDGGAQSIATIPLDSFTVAGADAVIYLFALWGLSQLLMGLLYGVVLWRYQTLLPLMYLLLVIEYGMRIAISNFKAMEVVGTAPGAVADYVLVPVALLMLWLALPRQTDATP